MSVETEQTRALSKLVAYLRRQGEQCNAQQPIVPVAGSELLKAADALEATRTPEASDTLDREWRDGAPPKPWSKEWFIALTTYGDRVVLKALPEEFTYDFKTADDTHIRSDKIAKWMQFPDSEYIAPKSDTLEMVVEALKSARHVISEMEPVEALGMVFAPPRGEDDFGHEYPVKLEVLSVIDAALAKAGAA